MFKSKIFVLISVIVCLVLTMSITANANLLAECNVCNATGHCDLCYGEKSITCHTCQGTGKAVCDQCSLTGKVTCHMCNGNGIDPANSEANCPQCEGAGEKICNGCNGACKISCNSCMGVGKENCVRCDGSGICGGCKGTGYKDGQTNGITNIPKKGDTVELLSGEYIKWGETNVENKPVENNNPPEQPIPPKEDPNKNENNNKPVQPKEDIKIIENNNPVQPVDISKPQENTNTTKPNTSDNTKPVAPMENNPPVAIVSMDVKDMEDKYVEKYNAYTEEQINNISNNVNEIVSTARINNTSAEVQNVVNRVLKENNVSEDKDAKICTINFEGHISMDFPVKVTVNIDKGIYNLDETIYAYHIVNNKAVESLGEAEKIIEDDRVIGIIFETTGFSDFFLSTEKLENDIQNIVDDTITTGIDNMNNTGTNPENNSTMIYIIASIVAVCIILAIVLMVKNRK